MLQMIAGSGADLGSPHRIRQYGMGCSGTRCRRPTDTCRLRAKRMEPSVILRGTKDATGWDRLMINGSIRQSAHQAAIWCGNRNQCLWSKHGTGTVSTVFAMWVPWSGIGGEHGHCKVRRRHVARFPRPATPPLAEAHKELPAAWAQSGTPSRTTRLAAAGRSRYGVMPTFGAFLLSVILMVPAAPNQRGWHRSASPAPRPPSPVHVYLVAMSVYRETESPKSNEAKTHHHRGCRTHPGCQAVCAFAGSVLVIAH